MPVWLLEFLRGAIPAFIKKLFAGLLAKQATQNQGAADQRAAQNAEDKANADDARKLSDEVHALSDADLDRAADEFRVRKTD